MWVKWQNLTRSVIYGNAAIPDRLFFFICLWTLELVVNHKKFANSFKMKVSYWLIKYTRSHSDNYLTRTKAEISKTNKQLFTYIHRSCMQLYIHNKNDAYVYKIKIKKIKKIVQCHKTVRKHSKISQT